MTWLNLNQLFPTLPLLEVTCLYFRLIQKIAQEMKQIQTWIQCTRFTAVSDATGMEGKQAMAVTQLWCCCLEHCKDSVALHKTHIVVLVINVAGTQGQWETSTGRRANALTEKKKESDYFYNRFNTNVVSQCLYSSRTSRCQHNSKHNFGFWHCNIHDTFQKRKKSAEQIARLHNFTK